MTCLTLTVYSHDNSSVRFNLWIHWCFELSANLQAYSEFTACFIHCMHLAYVTVLNIYQLRFVFKLNQICWDALLNTFFKAVGSNRNIFRWKSIKFLVMKMHRWWFAAENKLCQHCNGLNVSEPVIFNSVVCFCH